MPPSPILSQFNLYVTQKTKYSLLVYHSVLQDLKGLYRIQPDSKYEKMSTRLTAFSSYLSGSRISVQICKFAKRQNENSH